LPDLDGCFRSPLLGVDFGPLPPFGKKLPNPDGFAKRRPNQDFGWATSVLTATCPRNRRDIALLFLDYINNNYYSLIA
jgi:hypothetical protein